MTVAVKIDFVSDVACPWCAIGLKSLLIALDQLRDDVTAGITFHPFELNPRHAGRRAEYDRVRLRKISHTAGASPHQSREYQASCG